MDPERLQEIDAWYEDQKAMIEKAFLDKLHKNPLDQKAKATYSHLMNDTHKKFEKLATKEIENKHQLKKTMDTMHKEIIKQIDKMVEVYKE